MISEADRACLHVGYKQSMRALNEVNVSKAFLAEDCDAKISVPIEKLCSEKNVAVIYVATMKELGQMCSIDVSASCAVVVQK